MAGKDDKNVKAKRILTKYFFNEGFKEDYKVLRGMAYNDQYDVLEKTLKDVSAGKGFGSNPTQDQKDLMKSASETYNALKSIGIYGSGEKKHEKKDTTHTKPKFKPKDENKESSKPAAKPEVYKSLAGKEPEAEHKKTEEPAAKIDADNSCEKLIRFLNDYKGGEEYEHSLKGHLVGYLTSKPLNAEGKKTGQIKGVKHEIYNILDSTLKELSANPGDARMQGEFNMVHGLLTACYDNGIFKKKDEERLKIYSEWIESQKNSALSAAVMSKPACCEPKESAELRMFKKTAKKYDSEGLSMDKIIEIAEQKGIQKTELTTYYVLDKLYKLLADNNTTDDKKIKYQFTKLYSFLNRCYKSGIFEERDQAKISTYKEMMGKIESKAGEVKKIDRSATRDKNAKAKKEVMKCALGHYFTEYDSIANAFNVKIMQDLEDELFSKTIQLQNQLTAYEARFPGEKATPLQIRLKKYWTDMDNPSKAEKAPEPKAMDIDVQAREKSLDLDEHRKESVQPAETASADISQQTINMKELAKTIGTEKPKTPE